MRSEIRPLLPPRLSVTFVVREGPKVKVGKIRFEGNRHVKLVTCVMRCTTCGPSEFRIPSSWRTFLPRPTTPRKLDDDMELVREELQNRGYFKANVGQPQTRIRDTGHAGFHIPLLQHGPGKAMDITVPIDEGDRTVWAASLSRATRRSTTPKPCEICSQSKMETSSTARRFAKGLENLKNAYGTQGYINYTSVPTPSFDEAKEDGLLRD